jgi:4-amino-4-deoxy-L-arabinose transferase-like glycosyltransferase
MYGAGRLGVACLCTHADALMVRHTAAIREVRALRRDPTAWICVPLIFVGCVLSFVNVGVSPFWVDESMTVLPARSIQATLLPLSPYDADFMPWQLKHGLWDPATPLYRYSVAGFTALFGFSEATTRGFSVLMGLLWAIPLYALVRKLDGRKTALLVVTFLVTSPTFMIFAREARHFTLLGFMVLCTLYYLYTATEDRADRSRALWVVFLAATLLTQTLGYGILPIVAIFVLVNGPRRFFAWRHLPVYLIVAAVYLSIIAMFWETLPFFHYVGCGNRSECRPSGWYYVPMLYAFVAPLVGRPEEVLVGLSLLPVIFLIGLVTFVRAAWRGEQRLEKTSLLLPWFLVPLTALSMSEVKFDRYLFIWAMPFCALFLAYGVRQLLRLYPLRRVPVLAEMALVLLVVASPQLMPPEIDSVSRWPTLQSASWTYTKTGILNVSNDNWEKIRWQADYLRARMQPGDVVVTSLDDAGLHYYLDQFVYGFLNSRRSDEFLVGLLDRAEKTGTRVWFVDTLPHWGWCLSGEPEPWRIDCRIKYARFYARCTAADGRASPACHRLRIEEELPRWLAVRKAAAQKPE